MAFTEKTVLLYTNQENVRGTTLSLFFAVICIIDIFGVFPIITLPKTIINCGVYGLAVVSIICSFQIYTATLLGKSWLLACKIHSNFIQKDRYPYTALAELTFGRKLSKCVTILLNVTVFGGGIPNLIVASQNLNLFTINLFGMDISYCWWILVIGTFLCPILWLGSPKDMKFVCSISVLTVVSVFFFVIICLLQINYFSPETIQQKYSTNFRENSIWMNIIAAYGVLIFQYDIHPTILAIQMDMKKRCKINFALFYGFGASLIMFIITYILAYIKLGVNINNSILESLPTSVLLHLSALLVAFQLCLSSAISNSALYQNLEDYAGISKDFSYQRCILRSSLTILAIILAECVPQFDLIMSVIGGVLTGPLVFIFPPLIYLKLLLINNRENIIKLKIIEHPVKIADREDICYNSVFKESGINRSVYTKVEIIVCYFILAIGIAGIFSIVYVNIINKPATLIRPCIYNISFML